VTQQCLKRRACSGTVLHSKLNLVTWDDLREITLQGCIQVTKNGLDCLEVDSDALNGVEDILDVTNSPGKELDTLESCGGDAYD